MIESTYQNFDYYHIYNSLNEHFNIVKPEFKKYKIAMGTEEGLIFYSNRSLPDNLKQQIVCFKKILDTVLFLNSKPPFKFKKILLQDRSRYMILFPLNVYREKYLLWIEFPKGYSSKKCLTSAENIATRIKRIFKSNCNY